MPTTEELKRLVERAPLANAPYGPNGDKRLVGFVLPVADAHTTLTLYLNAVSAMRDSAPTLAAEVIASRTTIEALQARVGDLTEVLADKRRLVKELNVALDGTASESLCDAVSVAGLMREKLKEIASTVDQTACSDHLHCKLALDRIAILAKVTS